VSTNTAPATTTSAEQSAAEAWVASFIEGWRAPAGPDRFAAHFREMLAPDVRLIQPQLPTVTGRRGFEEQFARPLFALIPDVRGEVERWAARGETLYIELTLRGTLGGRPVSWRVCDRVTLRDGLAIERESYFDPGPLIAAVITTPRAWAPFLRLRLSGLANHLRTRRKT
jgi:ketosteroid isomerase-like protein